VQFQGWKMDDNTMYFKLVADNGKAILDNGLLEFAGIGY